MATIKSYTDISQSKTLSKILPLESADMTYDAITEGVREKMIIKDWQVNIGLNIAIKENRFSYRNGYMVPCWSLAALLGVLPYPSLHKTFAGWRCDSYDKEGKTGKLGENADNPIDVCVAMIERLHELNLL